MVKGDRRQLREIHRQYRAAAAENDWPAAYRHAFELLALDPSPDYPLALVGCAAMRSGRFDVAERSFQRLVERQPNDGNTYDGLAELYGRRTEAALKAGAPSDAAEARRRAAEYGHRALQLHDAEVTAAPLWQVPAGPPPGLAADKTGNVVAYTLFGAKPLYCETAFINARALAFLLPGWTMRVYCDRSVPEDVRQRLAARGAQVVLCEGPAWDGVDPLMRRFAVMADPTVTRWLVRDADSLISRREAAAVADWLASGRWFHVMRDAYTHTELLLAGLIGGCGGVFDGRLMAESRDFPARHQYERRLVDQHFLRQVVWPTFKQSLLSHDSWFGFGDARPFPVAPDANLGPDFHVGCAQSTLVSGAGSNLADGASLAWAIADERGRTVCSYRVTVTGGSWKTVLPKLYADNVRAGKWRIVLGQAPAPGPA
ncbi:tetratricopeptide repeat protein [Parasulfuritortus cantonensis]|uniref:Tetratricopeptide repeat protein n=1 Tax=Parasulfuritortus cantonensis TaxID=2528202 RepID=A0A4R1BNT5_9PROT|nr:tetratricopeptide repeat protein [Parasulfuritortus cantonensis]TCJ18945.1 tetratricopeptide repeat protein [Parasulfuritortus cantonensis]